MRVQYGEEDETGLRECLVLLPEISLLTLMEDIIPTFVFLIHIPPRKESCFSPTSWQGQDAVGQLPFGCTQLAFWSYPLQEVDQNTPPGRFPELLDVIGAWLLTGWNHRPRCFGYEQASLDPSDLQSGVASTCWRHRKHETGPPVVTPDASQGTFCTALRRRG